MAIINFALNKMVSKDELQRIVDQALTKRLRSGSLKRVHNEELVVEKYAGDKRTRGEASFDEVYEKMSEEEKKFYRIWQIEVDDEVLKTIDGGLEKVLANFNENANVDYAEQNQVYRLGWTPNDPLFGELYALTKMECAKAWNLSRGKGIRVAVVDSGLKTNHVDIARNIARDAQRRFIAYNFVDNNTNVDDNYGHGTHVAGIIAAIGNNGQGVVGIAPEAKIIPIKAFNRQKGSSITIANAIKFAADKGAKVINNSWSYDEKVPHDHTIAMSIEYALQKGAICVFAAGNNNERLNQNYWVVANPKLILVGATNQNDQKAPGSNWGPNLTVAAPGAEILSLDANTTNGNVIKNGTSMATAYVSGAIALYIALFGDVSAEVMKNKLVASVDPISGMASVGAGRLNCWKLLS